jgi:hypothetical protein
MLAQAIVVYIEHGPHVTSFVTEGVLYRYYFLLTRSTLEFLRNYS